MTQYTPIAGIPPDAGNPRRFVSSAEYKTVLGWLEKYQIEDGFYQELVQDTDWLPDFTRTNPFGSALSEPVWHWNGAFID
jgi:putative pyruvate formate lyase activating enzyme